MSKMKILTFCFVSIFVDIVFTETLNDVKKLYLDLLSNYNKNMFPLQNQLQTMDITFSMNLVQLVDLNEVSGKFYISAGLGVSWNDENLSWNPINYNLTTAIELPKKEVWLPTLQLLNSFNDVEDYKQGTDMITYRYNGGALWQVLGRLSTTCDINIAFYPFDTQVCTIMFGIRSLHAPKIYFKSDKNIVDTQNFHPHGTWTLLETSVSALNITQKLRGIQFTFTVKRQSEFFVYNMLLPIIVIMALTFLVFLLPVESGERVSYVITTLLALIVFLTIVSDNLPKTSNPMPSLSTFLIVNMLTSVAACIATIVQIKLFHLDEIKSPIPRCLRRLHDQNLSHTATIQISNSTGDIIKSVPTERKERELTWKDIVRFSDKVLFGVFNIILTMSVIMFLVSVT